MGGLSAARTIWRPNCRPDFVNSPRAADDVAQSVIEEVRGEHRVYVFTWENRKGQRNRVGHFRNSGWIQARRRAAARYVQELGKEAPAGFKNVRVLGHRSTRVTTDYSTGELRN